jgi:hypothetical protein
VRRVGLGGSWLRGLKRQACCCFWRDARRPLGIKLDHEISKDRATPPQEIPIYYNGLCLYRGSRGVPAGPHFLPGGKICRLRCVSAERDCLTGIRPILKSSF